MFGCSNHLVRRCRIGTALAYKVSQDAIMHLILAKLTLRPPDWAVVCTLWDEATHRLILQLTKSKQAALSQTWQVLVQRRTFLWGWTRTLNGETRNLCMGINVVIPPLPMLGVSARALHNGHDHHPELKSCNHFEKSHCEQQF